VLSRQSSIQQHRTTMTPKFLPPRQASKFLIEMLGFGAVSWLAKLRVLGGGPAYRKAGFRVVYTEDDLVEWAQAKLGSQLHSTSEMSAAHTPPERPSLHEESDSTIKSIAAGPQVTPDNPHLKRKRGRPRKTVIEPSARHLAE
jgi:hypothetical protein